MSPSMSDLPPNPSRKLDLVKINELFREFSEAVDQREREMWAVCFNPPQDAPALGYLPSAREYIGAVSVPDTTLPVVEAVDPVADLVRMYRLIRDHPEYP